MSKYRIDIETNEGTITIEGDDFARWVAEYAVAAAKLDGLALEVDEAEEIPDDDAPAGELPCYAIGLTPAGTDPETWERFEEYSAFDGSQLLREIKPLCRVTGEDWGYTSDGRPVAGFTIEPRDAGPLHLQLQRKVYRLPS